MDYTIDQIDTLQTVNQQKNEDIQRLNTQLTKALQVERLCVVYHYLIYKFFIFIYRQLNVQSI